MGDSMNEIIRPCHAVHGAITVPGDKSISHRYAMLTSIAEGESRITNYSTGADCQSTLQCMQSLGVEHRVETEDGRSTLIIQGKGLHGLTAPKQQLDAGNSGSTIRMLSGILAAQPFDTAIAGDESLAKRPMKRVMKPLSLMGARIEARNEQFPPLTIHGGPLRAIQYELPVASAQVKSCVLLAGLYAQGETAVKEPVVTRDHTEIALRELGADVEMHPREVKVRGGGSLKGRELMVPGDLSSAAFFIVAALIAPEGELVLSNVGLNPTRTALLDVLRGMGANIKLLNFEYVNGEIVGSLQIRASRLKGGTIQGATTAAVIDEVPILSVLGAFTQDGLIVKDAAELRVKETDRIDAIAQSLRQMRGRVNTTHDSIEVPGRQKLHGAEIDSLGDHRIAMAFAVAGLMADGDTSIKDAEAASVSFPEFYSTLRGIVQ
jgi:3-phosphoshikimate 1-carboxyvinyltransferase